MGTVLPGVVMVMHLDVNGMLVGVRMLVKVPVNMGVVMLVRVNIRFMLMLMVMRMGMFMGMQVFVFKRAFHDRGPLDLSSLLKIRKNSPLSRQYNAPPASLAGRRGEQLGFSGCKFGETFLNGLKFVLQIGLFVTESLGFIRRGVRDRGPSISGRAKRPRPETPAGSPAETAPAKAPGAAAGTPAPELATATTTAGATRTEAPSGARSLSHRSSSIKTWHSHYLLYPCAVGHSGSFTRGSLLNQVSVGE
jgi:hypothetical protein